MLLFMGLISMIFLLPSCHVLERKEAKSEEVSSRGIASRAVRLGRFTREASFVRISSGKFEMGWRGALGEDRRVSVEIRKPFMMMATEVTQKQYFQVMGRILLSLKGK